MSSSTIPCITVFFPSLHPLLPTPTQVPLIPTSDHLWSAISFSITPLSMVPFYFAAAVTTHYTYSNLKIWS